MVFAIHLPHFIMNVAWRGTLQLTYLKFNLACASRSFYLKRRFDLSHYFAGLKIHQATSLNMMVNEVHDSGSISSSDLYDKEDTKNF